MKILKKIILVLLIGFLSFSLAITSILYFKNDAVKHYVISQITKRVLTEVKYQDCNLTFWKTFPKISLDFSNVYIKDAWSAKSGMHHKDTLLTAHRLLLKFDLLKLIKKDYVINEIAIKKGRLKLLINKQGEANYNFWTAPSSDTSALSLSLKKVRLDEMYVTYTDMQTNRKLSLKTSKLTLKGDFANDVYDMDLKGEVYIINFKLQGVDYLTKKKLILASNFTVEKKNDRYLFNKTKLQIADLKFLIDGSFMLENKAIRKCDSMKLAISGDALELSSLKSILPPVYESKLEDYIGDKGSLSFNLLIVGEFSALKCPLIKAEFTLTNGEVSKKASAVTLNNINLKGAYSNNKSFDIANHSLELSRFSANLGNGMINGVIKFSNFISPTITTKTRAELSLADLNDFLKFDTIKSLTGNLIIDANYDGKINDIKNPKPADFINSKLSGILQVNNVVLKLKNDPYEFTEITGNLAFDNNDIQVNSLAGKYGNSDFALIGNFKNVLSYLFLENEKLTVETSFKSGFIDLNQLLAVRTKDNDKKKVIRFKIPNNLNVNFTLNIAKLKFQKLTAKNIYGNLKMGNKQLAAENLHLNAFDGNIQFQGLIEDQLNGKFTVYSLSKLNNINTSKMLYELNNVGQTMIKSEQVRGIADATIQFASILSENNNDFFDNLKLTTDITLKGGELINYKPLLSLSKFISVDELKDIKFNTLTSQINILNKVITFPQTHIASSALNVDISGSHSFNNDIDYRVKLLLSDVIGLRVKAAKKENQEFIVADDDNPKKMKLMVKIYGNVDNPKFELDKQGIKQALKENVKEEKQTVKAILKEEFGLFKKDSTLKKVDQQKKPKKVQLEGFDE